MSDQTKAVSRRSILYTMAERYGMEPENFRQVLMATVMPSERVSTEQFAAFLVVAHEHNLNPLTKEIYAFPGRSGGISPIVSIDGWLKLANSHPQHDGLTFEDRLQGTDLVAITCRVHRKDRAHPIEATEYMAECRRNTPTWDQWPRRSLRHKATIQGIRYAFGFAGIYDPDEGERIASVDAERAPVTVQDLLPAKKPDPPETEPEPDFGPEGNPFDEPVEKQA